MTQQQAASHWQQGARDSLDMAKLGCENGKYALALFHCHLTIEKALKSVYIIENNDNPPKTHNLFLLAKSLKTKEWSEEQLALLGDLTDYAVDSRYDDPSWAEKQATKEYCIQWIKHVEDLLSFLDYE